MSCVTGSDEVLIGGGGMTAFFFFAEMQGGVAGFQGVEGSDWASLSLSPALRMALAEIAGGLGIEPLRGRGGGGIEIERREAGRAAGLRIGIAVIEGD